MSNFNSINNGGVPYYFPADIAKEGQQYARFNNWLKTRVNDNGKKVPVKWYDQGRVMNVNGLTPFIQGMVGHFITDENDELIPSSDVVSRDWQGSTADVTDGGIAFYTLEDQFFCQEGQFKGVFGLRDNNGNVYTSVNIVFEILGNDLRMGETTKYYSSKLDKMVQEFHERTDQVINEARDTYNKEVQNTRDALQAKDTEVEAIRVEQRILGNQLTNYEDQIHSNDIIKRYEFNQNNVDMKNLVKSQLSQISNTPQVFSTLEKVKEKYPDGTNQLIITQNGHLAIWNGEEWTDGGIYQGIGISSNSIDINEIKNKYIDDSAPNLYSELSSNIEKGGFHKADGSFVKDENWGELTIGVVPKEQITWNQLTYCYTFWDKDNFLSGNTTNKSFITVTIPEKATFLKVPVSLVNTDTFNKDNFCIVRGSYITWNYPQKNVISKIWIPAKNVSHQVGYGTIVGMGSIDISKKDEAYYLNLPPESQVVYNNRMMTIENKKIVLVGMGHQKGTWLYFNPLTQMIETYSAPNDSEYLINLGVLYDSNEPGSWLINTKLPITVDSEPASPTKITDKNQTVSASTAMISGLGEVEVDTQANMMTFINLYIAYGHTTMPIDSHPIDITQIKKGAWLYYDASSNKIVSSLDQGVNHNWGLIGAFWYPEHIVLNGNPSIFIDGVKYDASEPLKGHKINVLGDSISQGINTSKSYVEDLKTVTGADLVRNYGVAGASISQRSINRFSWDTVEPLISSYTHMDKDADVIVIFAGVNDWVYGRQLGDSKSFDIKTFYGALNTLLTNLRNQYIESTILFVTPLQTDWTTRPANGVDDTSGKNVEGLYLKDYVNAIKETATNYAVPVLDLYSSMFYPFNKDFKDKYMTDSLHPTRAGHILLADRIGKFINGKV